MELATVAKAAKLAYDRVKDEESRKKTIAIILVPLMLLFLLLTLIAYILTSPFEAITSAIGAGEKGILKDIEDMRNSDWDVDPFTGNPVAENPSSKDGQAKESSDYTPSKIKQGATEVVYYNQGDEPWRNRSYGLRTIHSSGCGPTSMAIAISTLTGKNVTPAITADWAYKNGYCVTGYNNGRPYAMSSHGLVPALAREYGLKCEGISKGSNTEKRIAEALSEGKLVVAIMGRGHFTSGGHFIVLRGITKDGKILVADCASRSRTSQEWDLSLIVSESRNGASAGGPFWVISK